MVDATGIEPVTPTMSTNGIHGKHKVFQSLPSPFVPSRFRPCAAFHGRFMGARLLPTKNPGSLAGETGVDNSSAWRPERQQTYQTMGALS